MEAQCLLVTFHSKIWKLRKSGRELVIKLCGFIASLILKNCYQRWFANRHKGGCIELCVKTEDLNMESILLSFFAEIKIRNVFIFSKICQS